MKQILFILAVLIICSCSTNQKDKKVSLSINVKMSEKELLDKIKGGWAGQVIGCTFGGPTEFRYRGTMIPDSQKIEWGEDRCLYYYKNEPGLYDDVYMDLTFVEVFEKHGLDVSVGEHAKSFANAGYKLWHANQAARYNILRGIMPPESGHWKNNPHADDIDFQIEADFAGLMSPGMPNSATKICDGIGHIMNYGDGWYGGVYVAAMYSLAFISDDVGFIVEEALKAIPQESNFFKCIRDVIDWSGKYENWRNVWYEVDKKWSMDVGCPRGVFRDFNIDAKLNAAYVVIGLLYGKGDFTHTLEVSTRCGQDSDCNPASAGGILGVMMGYSKIPDYWKQPLKPVEDMDFAHTTMSLNDIYEIGLRHAKEMIKRNGGKTEGGNIEIANQEVEATRLEVSFEGHTPVKREIVDKKLDAENKSCSFEFEGIGFVVSGKAVKLSDDVDDHEFMVEVWIDDKKAKEFPMSTDFTTRKVEICGIYSLGAGNHQVEIKIANPKDGYHVKVYDYLVYIN